MVVLHVVEALSGGIGRHIVDIIRNVPDVRHEVALPRARHGWVEGERPGQRMEAAGAQLHVVDMTRLPIHPANAGAVRRVARLISELSPNVVHGHSSIGGAVARLAQRPSGVACVYTPNALHPHPVALRLERWLSGRTDRVVAVSESERRALLQWRVVPPENLVLIPNGVDMFVPIAEEVNLRLLLGLAPSTPLVGAVGRLVAQKAPDVFARACSRLAAILPAVHFVLVGSGPLEGAVRRVVDEERLVDRFHIVPWLDDVTTVLGQLDVLVSTSRFEGGPYIPLEGMRAGVPLVLSQVTGNVDDVEDGVSGLLVPVDDPVATATTVGQLLADDGLRLRLAAAAKQRLAERFDVRQMGSRTAALYAEVLSR